MDGQSDAIRFLKSLTHFAGLQSATVNTIASRCRLRSRQAGEDLFLEGDPCRDLYILVSGRVKCFRASAEGREQILKIFERPGDMAVPAVALTFYLLGQPRVPAMLLLLAYGAAAALSVDQALVHDLASLAPGFRVPTLHIPPVSWPEIITGALVLAVPQMALTLGNAVIATAEEHNALFPHRRISVRFLALDHGLMNLAAAPLGGVPMCRGAGGIAGHVRFGARTGGALVILGLLLLIGALFFADSFATVFRLFPVPVLGVILFFGGIELAVGLNGDTFSRSERTVLVVTAGIALWNMYQWTKGRPATRKSTVDASKFTSVPTNRNNRSPSTILTSTEAV